MLINVGITTVIFKEVDVVILEAQTVATTKVRGIMIAIHQHPVLLLMGLLLEVLLEVYLGLSFLFFWFPL
jgi:hypothetical protein